MSFSIHTMSRTPGRAQAVRAEGFIPAVLYGPDISSTAVSVNYRLFEKLYRDAGESSLIDCVIEGRNTPIPVVIQDVQYDPAKGRIIHVDFRQVKMSEEMNVAVELRFVGESPAVKGLGGTLLKAVNIIHVRCLPKDLVAHIDVDLSGLATFDDMIHVKDVSLPSGLAATDDRDMVVAKVLPPLTEDQIKAMEEEGMKGVEAVAVVEKKKEEEAPEGEGETPVGGEKKEEAKNEGKNEGKK